MLLEPRKLARPNGVLFSLSSKVVLYILHLSKSPPKRLDPAIPAELFIQFMNTDVEKHSEVDDAFFMFTVVHMSGLV